MRAVLRLGEDLDDEGLVDGHLKVAPRVMNRRGGSLLVGLARYLIVALRPYHEWSGQQPRYPQGIAGRAA